MSANYPPTYPFDDIPPFQLIDYRFEPATDEKLSVIYLTAQSYAAGMDPVTTLEATITNPSDKIVTNLTEIYDRLYPRRYDRIFLMGRRY